MLYGQQGCSFRMDYERKNIVHGRRLKDLNKSVSKIFVANVAHCSRNCLIGYDMIILKIRYLAIYPFMLGGLVNDNDWGDRASKCNVMEFVLCALGTLRKCQEVSDLKVQYELETKPGHNFLMA